MEEESSRAAEAESLLGAAERTAASQSQRARAAEQAAQHHGQRAELAERTAEEQAHAAALAKDEVQQLRGQVQCLSGHEGALQSQPVAGLLSIEALLEASLQRIRAAVTKARLQVVVNGRMKVASACIACVELACTELLRTARLTTYN